MECPVDNSHRVHPLTQTADTACKIMSITTGICLAMESVFVGFVIDIIVHYNPNRIKTHLSMFFPFSYELIYALANKEYRLWAITKILHFIEECIQYKRTTLK